MNKGFVSAKENKLMEIMTTWDIKNEFITIKNNKFVTRMPNERWIPFDLYDWRCEQYKKYVGDEISFCNHYSDFYKLFMKQGVYHYEFWLFDFVMNGGLDNEKVEV